MRVTVVIRGRLHEWAIPAQIDRATFDDWRADGLDVTEVVNVIPAWVPRGLVSGWCALQDLGTLRYETLTTRRISPMAQPKPRPGPPSPKPKPRPTPEED